MPISLDLIKDNPWWKNPNSIQQDMKILELSKSLISQSTRTAYTFDFSNDLVYSLRGPRQVGKTTLLKAQIQKKLDEGVSPYNIMYYAFDVDTTPKDLVNIVKEYLDHTKRFRKNDRTFIFLDDISVVKEWQRGIKRLWDQGRFTNCTVITTGPNTVDIEMFSEKLPGRRGTSNDTLDKVILPMNFLEFVSSIDPDIKDQLDKHNLTKAGTRHMILEKILNLDLDLSLDQLWPYIPELNQYLKDYLLTGGIPKIVHEYLDKGTIEEETFKIYLDTILGDLQSLGRKPNTFKQIVQGIIKVIGNISSWRSIQKSTDIGSSDTVSSYVEMLQSMFILSVFYQYGVEVKRGLFQKDKKIYFQDPFYFHVLNGWLGGDQMFFDVAMRYLDDDSNQAKLVEGVVANHLIRMAFNKSPKKQNFEYSNLLFYWRYGPNREVDFVYNNRINTEIPIEIKFQNNISVRDLDGLINFKRRTGQKNAVLLTKDKLSLDRECVMIPSSLFLLLS